MPSSMLKRNYVILFTPPGSDLWTQFTASYARSRRAAIERAIVGDRKPGSYQAILAREWRPREYEVR